MRGIIAAAAVAAVLALGGCNTVEGVGRDISAAGKAVSRTASDIKR